MNLEETKFRIKQKIKIKFIIHIEQPVYNAIITFNRKFRKFDQPSTTELLKNYNITDYEILEEIEK